MPGVHGRKKDLVGKHYNKKPILCNYCQKQLIWKKQRFFYTCFLDAPLQIPKAQMIHDHHKCLEAHVGLLQSWALISGFKSLVYVPNTKQNLKKDCVLFLQLPQG